VDEKFLKRVRHTAKALSPARMGSSSIQLNRTEGVAFGRVEKTDGNKSCVLNTARREMFKGTTKRIAMRKQQHAPTITDSMKTLK